MLGSLMWMSRPVSRAWRTCARRSSDRTSWRTASSGEHWSAVIVRRAIRMACSKVEILTALARPTLLHGRGEDRIEFRQRQEQAPEKPRLPAELLLQDGDDPLEDPQVRVPTLG